MTDHATAIEAHLRAATPTTATELADWCERAAQLAGDDRTSPQQVWLLAWTAVEHARPINALRDLLIPLNAVRDRANTVSDPGWCAAAAVGFGSRHARPADAPTTESPQREVRDRLRHLLECVRPLLVEPEAVPEDEVAELPRLADGCQYVRRARLVLPLLVGPGELPECETTALPRLADGCQYVRRERGAEGEVIPFEFAGTELCVRWRGRGGVSVCRPLDAETHLLLVGAVEQATWLPEGWSSAVYPTGTTLRHAQAFLRHAAGVVGGASVAEEQARALLLDARWLTRRAGVPVPADDPGKLSLLGVRDALAALLVAIEPMSASSPCDLNPQPAASANGTIEVAPSLAPALPIPLASSPPRQEEPTVGESMLLTLLRRPESCTWSQRKWAIELGCVPSSIAEALNPKGERVWDTIKELRARYRMEYRDHQDEATNHPRARRSRDE